MDAEPAIPEPLAPGRVIDGWRLEEKLYTGGMAHLWRVSAVPSAAGPVVAATQADGEPLPLIMKVPRIKGGEDPASIVGFEVEQLILPALHGPHVPRFVARGDFSHQPYIVMERIEGPSLRPRLDEAPLPFDDITEIGLRVATALHDLHRQHLVHLDVKPSNIVFRPDGTAVMVDFGLSHHDRLPDLLEEEFTLPMGTGPYMSPEQVQFVRNDPRSDLFALGVILYHLTTGQRPFGAPESVRGLRRRLYVDPIPPRVLRADCPPWLQEVILKCLEVKPDRRWQSAAQLVLALQDPLQVPLTARAHRQRTSGPLQRLKRWFLAAGAEPEVAPIDGVTRRVAKNPIILAAIDVEQSSPELLEQLRETARRIVVAEPGARLACVSVMKTARIGMDQRVDAAGQSRHVKQLVGLKHWARPINLQLDLQEGRLTFHVLEAPDAAAAIIEFAARNQADHIIMGARANSTLRRYLGSISSQVVAQAACTVTVVRA
ncbi:MAG: serine/threonine protein kinase [Burkholderiales bacterium PBB1]|nr:MAG: serine/threonine protein kinase [Burkholderiales bacterium PBB1]